MGTGHGCDGLCSFQGLLPLQLLLCSMIFQIPCCSSYYICTFISKRWRSSWGLGEDRGGTTQPLAVFHPWVVKLQRPLFLAAARKVLALLCSPSCSFFHKYHSTTAMAVVPLAGWRVHHSTSQFWAAPTAASAPSLHLHHALLYPSTKLCFWEQWGRKKQSFQDLSPSSVLQQPGWAASISPTERDAEPQNHGRWL